jgi:predicted nucleic-acid-binding Zn-ribbon protein
MRRCKATPSLNSIKAHCRRSNYTLNRIIAISPYRNLDDSKRGFILSTCKRLQHLEFYGNGIIYDSLISVVQRTSIIRTIIIGKNIIIPAYTVYYALKYCPQIVHAEFRHIDGFLSTKAEWYRMNSLETLNLTCGGSISLTVLDLVSFSSITTSFYTGTSPSHIFQMKMYIKTHFSRHSILLFS